MRRLYFLIILLALTIVSCGDKSKHDLAYSSESSVSAEQSLDSKNNIEIERKLIKTGSLKFQTDSLEVTKRIINQAILESKAYVAQEKNTGSSNSVTIRVPFVNFEALLDKICIGAKKIDSKNIDVLDITGEYIDVQARIKTKKELEARYKEILKKAYTVEDILKVERELGILRADIESMEGRLKYLESQVSFSTITVHYYIPYSAERIGFTREFVDSVKDGWNGIIWFVLNITKLWAFGILAIAVFFIVKKARKKSRDKRNLD